MNNEPISTPQTADRIRVVIADDHPIVRAGIRNELSRHADIAVVGEAATGDEVLELARTLQPNIILLDINMPGLKAVQLIRELRAWPIPPHILVLTAYSDQENILGMLQAGASGYLLKDEALPAITQGVRTVAGGKPCLSAAVTESLVGHALEITDKMEQIRLLSQREIAVIKLLARGYDNSYIAQRLVIAEGTVKNHITNIYTKLGLHSRAEAVAWAWQQGLVEEK